MEYKNIAKTLIRVFIAAAISTALTVGVELLTSGDAATLASAWTEVGRAGLTAVLTMALVFVDPGDGRYGVGSDA